MDSSKSDLKLWKFRVRDDSSHPGTMCITGDCDTLGNWSTENIIPMTYDCAKKIWTVVVYLPYDRIVNYRYLICTRIDSTNPIKTMIHKWETNLQPRSVKFNEISDESNEKIDVFGVFENTQKIENGWLTSDVVVQLTLHSDAIQWHTPNDDENKKVYIKLLPALKSNNIQSGKGCSEISISVSNENGKFRKQDEAGYAFHDASSAVFMTRAFTVDKLGFVFEFTDTSCEEKKKLFSFLALEDRFHNTCGVITVPIHSDQHEYLGTLSVKYLIVRPLPELNCKLKVSYAKYWNNAWTGLEIGHRGSGVSFTNSKEKNAKWRENTIGSFKEAGQLGAHLIEFDVQLTNDFIPTIYHDFHVLLDVHKRKDFNTGGRKMIFPFHKLNYEELKDFKVMHLNESNLTFSFENDDQEEYSPFPSLEQVLQQIDPQIGFNIEIKYNSQLEDGSNELDHPIDMNEYVDRILKVVYANGGRRYIVFSSFNPDVCLMLRTKQNKYPVMFLTQGITKRYPPYSDERMRDIDKAVKFANSADLLGIVAHSEELLQNIDYVQYVLENDLVLFCWGDDNNDINTISALREKGVHGIIFDRIDQYGQKLKKNFFQDGLVN